MIMDQAQRLREFLQQQKQKLNRTRVLAVTSGKGGVGKSNFTVNFALSLIAKGQKVVVCDMDLGMANIDILLGLTPRYHLLDMIEKDKSIWDIIEKGPKGMEFIAGGSGFQDILRLDEEKLIRFFQQMALLQGYADTVILDMGAGISQESLRFILAADEVLMVTTPEPTAITDAYSMLKILHAKNPDIKTRLVINRVESYQEGKQVAEKIRLVAKEFLKMEVGTLGYMKEDAQVMQAVKKQIPYSIAFPGSSASREIQELAESYLTGRISQTDLSMSGMKGFIQKLRKFVKS